LTWRVMREMLWMSIQPCLQRRHLLRPRVLRYRPRFPNIRRQLLHPHAWCSSSRPVTIAHQATHPIPSSQVLFLLPPHNQHHNQLTSPPQLRLLLLMSPPPSHVHSLTIPLPTLSTSTTSATSPPSTLDLPMAPVLQISKIYPAHCRFLRNPPLPIRQNQAQPLLLGRTHPRQQQ